jgi:hypothetical protein
MGERTNDEQPTTEHEETTTTTYQRQVHERADADGNVVSRQVRESVSTSGGADRAPQERSGDAADQTGSPGDGDGDAAE